MRIAKPQLRRIVCVLQTALPGLLLAGCGPRASVPEPVWALNVGGPPYVALDGTLYRGDDSAVGGETGRMTTVKGSQDAALYQSYREGEMRIAQPIADGIYDITFHFAEPADIQGGERVFAVQVEGRRAIDALDVMAFRDGKIESALTVTVPNIEIADGQLDIEFHASVRRPILSAVLVRSRRPSEKLWRLVWSDEFEVGEVPDPAKWSPEEWPARKVNDEDQAYTRRAKNLRVANGHLVIEAHKEAFETAAYTSGRVHSGGKGDFLYGRFEVRAKLPQGRGTWPAIWMLPSDPFRYASSCEDGAEWQGNATCDAWPNSGEIDIMEHVGHQLGHVHGTVHNLAYYWLKWEQRKGRILIGDAADTFHVYALEWSPTRIDAYVDDTLYFSYFNENDGWESWPYDQPFHLILNVAVGGQWGRSGGGIDDSTFPQQMLVDYVRVYEAGN